MSLFKEPTVSMRYPSQAMRLPMLNGVNNLSGHIDESKKQEGSQKSGRIRPKMEHYPNENAITLVKAAVPKARHKTPSILPNNSFSGRPALMPISINSSNPVRLSPPSKLRARRFRSGSEGKIQSLRPVEDDFDSPQQRPKDDAFHPLLGESQLAPPNFTIPEENRLSLNNLKTLTHLSQKFSPSHNQLKFLQNGFGESHIASNLISEKATSKIDSSLFPELGSSPKSLSSSDEKPSIKTNPQAFPSTFFYPGITLPAPPPREIDGFDPYRGDDLSDFPQSNPSREAIMRLETMILKQRRVDFEPEETSATKKEPTLNEFETRLDERFKRFLPRKCSKMGKVRCALLDSERLLGIKWIHNVDTTSTTNPHITSEIRYHATLLFSLYWGSRSSRVVKPDNFSNSQQKITRDLHGEREAKKKMKLIAATAMACLTLTIKWHFDFCKPLFTLQLLSFCKTTDFRTFRVTPEDLIVAERAILFSYPIAGGLWLDSPHAFLEELVLIVPSLRQLSKTPRYAFSRKGTSCPRNSVYGLAEFKSGSVVKNTLRWDWPEVVHKFERTLERATIKQEFLAFEPSVFCVVALYISLDAAEPGYYEEKNEATQVPDEAHLNRSTGQAGAGWVTGSRICGKGKEHVNTPVDLSEEGGSWIWRYIDINDTMDQVCRVIQVSGDEVESCLDWFCQLENF